MASFSSKEIDFRVTRLMGSKVFNHKKNPRGVNEVSEKQKEDCNVVITLRNVKEYEETKLLISEDISARDEPTVEKNARNEKECEKYEEVIASKDKRSISNHLHFSLTMHRHKVRDKTLEILEVLKQVKIKIPPLDMIKKVPAYEKFLNDLCTMKRMIKLSKKAFLTEQVSAIIENKAMVKYKDPGCLTISVQIGDSFIERALLDLGASVNLLPYSIYKKLGLGELKATTITLSLADRSIKVPRVVENVLVQVENFYYLVDFMLSFGNMTMEMNVFNLCKQPMDHDDLENEEAYLIKALWKEKCTIQSLNNVENDEENKKGEVEISKPELKPLPHGLNSWVSPTQVVPKKNGISVVKNDEGELLPIRLTIGWQDAEFIWTKACQEAFERLKSLFTIAPIMRPPNWSLPFELMCDASDYAVGAILGQREDGKPYVVYYASKTLNDA
ncbi:hypothetical protein CK203_026423 [Vitis vinifera]|uniref:Reverse transcriptase/retrotransposon-derived protein RNase H-like domain-containing protein n=1 Tax=Vitis vinifera TaxID=29760 RepID=A0A438IW22_VITVI|nr:hypothetical protein CK203_026423 [Vitis vinifera]